MKKKRVNITPKQIFFILLAILVGGGFLLGNAVKQLVFKDQQEAIEKKIDVLIPFIWDDSNNIVNFDKLNYLSGTDQHLTIFDTDGSIQYDSLSQNKSTDKTNESVFKKVNENKKMSISLNKETGAMDVTKAIYKNNQLLGFIQLSEPNEGSFGHLRTIWCLIWLYLLVVGCLMGFAYNYSLKKKRQDVQLVDSFIQKTLKTPNHEHVLTNAPDEWHHLYQTINNLVRAELSLYKEQQQANERLSILMNYPKIGIFILNSELKVIFSNRVTHNLFGKSKKPKQSNDWFSNEMMNKLIKEARSTKKKVQGNIHLIRDSDYELNVTIYPTDYHNSQFTEYIGIIDDMTEIKQLEQIHSDFIGNISHELKTPTTSIIGFSETLLSGAKDDPETAETFIKIIEKEGNRLLALIQNILALLKTEKDLSLEEALTNKPVLIVNEEINRYLFKASEKNISLHFESHVTTDNELPLTPFQIIVKNLLENALEYTPSGGEVTVYLQEMNHELTLTIEDTGMGISNEDQKRIFERFYSVSQSRQRNTGGSGLGLSIVKHYTQILGGHISIKSEIDIGTTIMVKIPIQS